MNVKVTSSDSRPMLSRLKRAWKENRRRELVRAGCEGKAANRQAVLDCDECWSLDQDRFDEWWDLASRVPPIPEGDSRHANLYPKAWQFVCMSSAVVARVRPDVRPALDELFAILSGRGGHDADPSVDLATMGSNPWPVIEQVGDYLRETDPTLYAVLKLVAVPLQDHWRDEARILARRSLH
jgi:hypothetical protein